MEVHSDRDQFFRFQEGEGKIIIGSVEHKLKDEDAAIASAGGKHNVVNAPKKMSLKLYTICSPPEHQDKVMRHTKADAEASPEEFNGKSTE